MKISTEFSHPFSRKQLQQCNLFSHLSCYPPACHSAELQTPCFYAPSFHLSNLYWFWLVISYFFLVWGTFRFAQYLTKETLGIPSVFILPWSTQSVLAKYGVLLCSPHPQSRISISQFPLQTVVTTWPSCHWQNGTEVLSTTRVHFCVRTLLTLHFLSFSLGWNLSGASESQQSAYKRGQHPRRRGEH